MIEKNFLILKARRGWVLRSEDGDRGPFPSEHSAMWDATERAAALMETGEQVTVTLERAANVLAFPARTRPIRRPRNLFG